jgi:predicted nucleic acid-binding protein
LTKTSTIFDTPTLFVDTWGWLVLADVAEPAHTEVRQLRKRYGTLRVPWVTTDYVLDETITRVFARAPFQKAEAFCSRLLEAARKGTVAIESITPRRFRAAYALRLRYRDKPRISFTDLTSFAVMRELGIQHVLTRDLHFQQSQMGFITLPFPTSR